MKRTTRGEDEAFTALYRRELPVAAHAAYVITGSSTRAQDIAQEALAVAYAKWSKVQHLDRPGAWVRRVAINLAIKDRHREARQRLGAEGHAQPAVAEVDRDTRAVLAAAIARLPQQQKLAVVFHYFHDLPVAEVAGSLGCSESTAKVHLHRARQTLAGLLPGDLGAP